MRALFARRNQEIQTAAGVLRATLLLIPVTAVMIAGYIGGQSFGLVWAPVLAGVIVALVVIVLAELACRPADPGLNRGERR